MIPTDECSASPEGGGGDKQGDIPPCPAREEAGNEGLPTGIAPLAWETTPGGAPQLCASPASRPPSWRTHSIITRVGPGGGAHLHQLDRPHGRPVSSGRTRDVKGSFALEPRPPCASRPASHPHKGDEVMEEV